MLIFSPLKGKDIMLNFFEFFFLQTDDIFAKMEAVAAIHWQGGAGVTSESEAAIDL